MRKKFYVARDKDGTLFLYSGGKPVKCKHFDGQWGWSESVRGCCTLPKTMFPNVKWEDKEPLEVKLISSRWFNKVVPLYGIRETEKNEYNIRNRAKSSKRTKKAQKS